MKLNIQKLSKSISSNLAIKDGHGYVLPFDGGRFRIDDDLNITDTGIRNKYPNPLHRLENSTAESGGSGLSPTLGNLTEVQHYGSAVPIIAALDSYGPEYDYDSRNPEATIWGAYHDKSSGRYYTCRDDGSNKVYVYEDSNEHGIITNSTNEALDYVNYTHGAGFFELYASGDFVYIIVFDGNPVLTCHVRKLSDKDYTHEFPINTPNNEQMTLMGIVMNESVTESSKVAYTLWKSNARGFVAYANEINIHPETGEFDIFSNWCIINNDVNSLINTNSEGWAKLLGIRGNTLIIVNLNTQMVYQVDLLLSEVLSNMISRDEHMATAVIARHDQIIILERTSLTAITFVHSPEDGYGVSTATITGTYHDLQTTYAGYSAGRDLPVSAPSAQETREPILTDLSSGGSGGGSGGIILAPFPSVDVVGPNKKYATGNTGLPFSNVAVTIADISPDPINLAYLYALATNPLLGEDSYFTQKGNILVKVIDETTTPMLTEWVIDSPNEVDGYDGRKYAVVPCGLSIAKCSGDGLLYDLNTLEVLKEGTHRDTLVLSMPRNDEAYEVTRTKLAGVHLGLCTLTDDKEFIFVDGDVNNWSSGNVVPFIQEVTSASSSSSDDTTDFLK